MSPEYNKESTRGLSGGGGGAGLTPLPLQLCRPPPSSPPLQHRAGYGHIPQAGYGHIPQAGTRAIHHGPGTHPGYAMPAQQCRVAMPATPRRRALPATPRRRALPAQRGQGAVPAQRGQGAMPAQRGQSPQPRETEPGAQGIREEEYPRHIPYRSTRLTINIPAWARARTP